MASPVTCVSIGWFRCSSTSDVDIKMGTLFHGILVQKIMVVVVPLWIRLWLLLPSAVNDPADSSFTRSYNDTLLHACPFSPSLLLEFVLPSSIVIVCLITLALVLYELYYLTAHHYFEQEKDIYLLSCFLGHLNLLFFSLVTYGWIDIHCDQQLYITPLRVIYTLIPLLVLMDLVFLTFLFDLSLRHKTSKRHRTAFHV